MNDMLKRSRVTVWLLLLGCLVSSCATISYTPTVSLDISPKTINKTIFVEKFVDKTPEKDKKNPFLGISVTNKEALANDLSIEITRAVIGDFQMNGVFKDLSRRNDNADFIMKGEIRSFTGKCSMTKYGLISLFTVYGPLTWYFGVPVKKNETRIELMISLYDRSNQLVGKYSGVYKDKSTMTVYNNKSLALVNLTNKSFSNAISDIREQLMRDINKYQ